MAVMNSLEVWSASARDPRRGLEWRDAVTARMIAEAAYVPYEDLVVEAAAQVGLPAGAAPDLFRRWRDMDPWPDAADLSRVRVPFAFVSNCSTALARVAAHRSGLRPEFVLSAEEAGSYKPDARIYREACRRLGSPAASTLFVAGSPYDAAGAHEAGLQAALVVRRPDLRPSAAPIRLVASLDEIVLGLEVTA
jgi:2-haloacid dehalogenase